ncbi:hypothetical protein RJT34_16520 [Clitoria ternatea]|uniref:Uncharacterized protein n=1 Tax=Clitoria ternatea TaxID=43366 RepID=A0AAN9J7K0_CLITE
MAVAEQRDDGLNRSVCVCVDKASALVFLHTLFIFLVGVCYGGEKCSFFSLEFIGAPASSSSSPLSSSYTQRCVEPEWSCMVMVNSAAVCNHVGQHGAVFWRLVPPLHPLVDGAVCVKKAEMDEDMHAGCMEAGGSPCMDSSMAVSRVELGVLMLICCVQMGYWVYLAQARMVKLERASEEMGSCVALPTLECRAEAAMAGPSGPCDSWKLHPGKGGFASQMHGFLDGFPDAECIRVGLRVNVTICIRFATGMLIACIYTDRQSDDEICENVIKSLSWAQAHSLSRARS